VSSSQTSQQVHLSIAGGINSGDTVKWLSNNGSTSTTSTIATDTVSGTSYSATKTVALSGASTYVRVEVWRGTKLRGMTEAIMFSRSGSADTQPPTTPTGLSATAFGSSQINLAWTGSTDNVQVSGYRIYRDGGSTPVAAVTSTSYADTGLAAGSTHSYVVTAVDSSGNESAPSNQASATTDSAGSVQTVTLAPVADAYVNGGSTTSNYGSSTALRVDASPDVRSYLQFNLSGVSGTVTSAVLHVWATSSQSTGYQAVPLADPGATWGESTINYTNAPPLAAATPAYGSSGPVTTGTWTTVDVTGFVTAVEGGVATLALTTPSSTALALASRQSTNPPQLVITTG
jgi:chitodextrinase